MEFKQIAFSSISAAKVAAGLNLAAFAACLRRFKISVSFKF